MVQSDRVETGARPLEWRGGAGELKRNRDIFESGHRRNEMERLENNANPRAAEARERILAKAIEASAVHLDRTRSPAFQGQP